MKITTSAGTIAALAVIAAAPITLLAACSSASSSTHTARSGTELFVGDTAPTSDAPKVPLTAIGVFADRGSITLSGNGNAGTGALVFSNGNITVYHMRSPGHAPADKLNPDTCILTSTETGTYKVLSGTGVYKGITGHGTYSVTFTATMPAIYKAHSTIRYCDQSKNAQPVSGSEL